MIDTKESYRIRRNYTEKGEKIVAEYLDDNFYKDWTISLTRNYDKETQIQGIDLTVTDVNSQTYTIDEKATLEWANRTLKTFAHEVTAIDITDKEYNGWLLHKNSTDYYVYVWLDKATMDEHNHLNKKDDIKEITAALVKKQDLFNWFKKHNITGEDLIKKSREIRENFEYYGDDYWKYTNSTINGYKMTLQTTKRERGVNILIPREDLIDIATYAVKIYENNKQILRRNFIYN